MLALAAGLTAVAAPARAASSESAGAPGAGGPEPTAVTIAILPAGTTTDQLAAASPRLAVGTLSAGIGTVRPAQTYLDIGQGNRLGGSLYPSPLRQLHVPPAGGRIRGWRQAVTRADGAPADLVPGLLAQTLATAGIKAGGAPPLGPAALIAAANDGVVRARPGCARGGCPGLTVVHADAAGLGKLVRRASGEDVVIALEQPKMDADPISVGIAGPGFAGTLTSESTRLDGFVLSTDLAPTVLEALGVSSPSQMSGRPIEADGHGDRAEPAQLRARLLEVVPRRGPVLGVNALIWLALTLLAALIWRGPGARLALPLLAAGVALVPGLLLLTAALEPSLLAERLIVGAGGPLLAGLLLWIARRPAGLGPARARYAAFAAAATLSVGATAIDVVAGSPLTTLSLLGPSPGLGVRFYGIGNELEAVIGALLPLGAGAAVAAAAPADQRRAVAIVAAIAAALGVAVFAPGRFGADVGAAITFPAAAVAVALAALGLARRRVALLIGAPSAALAALVAVDLASGGDSHLTRSVLDAGGLHDVGQVLERRIKLSATSFERFWHSWLYATALAVILAGIVFRRRLSEWMEPFPAASAGFVGGIVAAVVGALANDSGATLLFVGTALLVAYAGLGWSTRYFTSGRHSG